MMVWGSLPPCHSRSGYTGPSGHLTGAETGLKEGQDSGTDWCIPVMAARYWWWCCRHFLIVAMEMSGVMVRVATPLTLFVPNLVLIDSSQTRSGYPAPNEERPQASNKLSGLHDI